MIKIPFSPPDITQDEIDGINEALRSGWITTGPKTKKFENELSAYTNTNKTVCFNSATAALEMALRFLGIGAGDEVIGASYTYSASCSVIDHVGAKIVMVDTEPDSYEVNYNQIEESITSKTKAIIPVDVGGMMCDYKRLLEIVEGKKALFSPNNEYQEVLGRVAIIADGAHSFGASKDGKRSGEAADFTAFSFHAVKNLTTAEGGSLTWRDIPSIDNEEVYKELMLLSLHGQSKDALAKTQLGAWEYDIVYPGYKCNMTDIMAAFGLAQLHRYADLLKKREQLIFSYEKVLEGASAETLKHIGRNFKSSGHLYMVRLLNKTEQERNTIIQKMAEAGIATNVHYKPLPMHTAYKKLGFSMEDFPNAYKRYRNEITLPLHTLLTETNVDYVGQVLRKLL